MTAKASIQRFAAPPPRNVGGGDLVTRMLAVFGMLMLAGMTIPQALVPYPLLKICLLFAAELGLVILMLGLFLRAKTYFAGLELFLTPLLMLWLINRGFPWLAVLLGLIAVGLGVISIATRRSRLNHDLQVSSLHVPLEEMEAAAAGEVLPDGGVKAPVAVLKPLTDGAR